MIRILSSAARLALAVVVALLASAVLRWTPVHASSLLDVRALTLYPVAVVLGVVAALGTRDRRRWPVAPFAWALVAGLLLLGLSVAARPPAGLACAVSDPRGRIGLLPPGAVDVAGPDLHELPGTRRWTLRFAGELRAARSGAYRLWVVGRGRAEVRVDGRTVLRAEGEEMRGGADVGLTAGAHTLEVVLERVGPGPRLRLGWTTPGGPLLSRDETIPPRQLGAPAGAWWWITDAAALLIALALGGLVLAIPWDAPRRLPAPGPWTVAEVGVSLLGHAVVLLVMSWPLVLDLAGSGVMDRPDGRLNAWIMAWVVEALLTDPGRLFAAPAFHPLPDALAFSENLLLPAIVAAPALRLGGPVLGYNLVLLLALALSGLGTQALVRRVSGDRLAAFVAGALFAAGAHRWIRLAHLHAQVTWFFPLALLALDRFHERQTLRRALSVGLTIALQALSSIYLGAIAATAVAAGVVGGVLSGWRVRALLRLAAGAAVGALIVLPVMLPYLRMRGFQGVEWTIEDIRTYATTLTSYAASGNRAYGGVTQRHLDPADVQDTLFPGLVLLIAGLAGVARAPRRFRVVFVIASVLAIVISLGPQTAFYRFLHEHVVLVRGVRALSRFSLIPVLGLCVMAGLALSGRRRSLVVGALALSLWESSNVPLRYAPAPGTWPVTTFLADGSGAIADLPLGDRDTDVMLQQLAHWRPLVNGDSGFIPRPYTRAMALLAPPITDDALRFLRAVGVTDVTARVDLDLPLKTRLGDERVYAVPPGEAARVVTPGRPLTVLWSRTHVTADLGAVQPLQGIVFEVSDAEWLRAPEVELSSDGVTWTPVDARASLADAVLSLSADPRAGLGEVRFAPARARFVRTSRRLPARPGLLWLARVEVEVGALPPLH